MIKLGKKVYSTMIMDNSDEHVVNRISGIQKAYAKNSRNFARYTYGEQYSMTVLRVEATKAEYNKIKKRVEELYPGLCVFNAPLRV